MRAIITEDVRITQGPSISDELRELFTSDGTFEKIRESMELEVRRQIAADLRDAAKKQAEEDLSDPTTRQAYVDEETAKLADDPEITEHASKFRDSMEQEWQDEAQQRALAAAEAVILADKEQIIKRLRDDYSRSRQGQYELDNIKTDARDRIIAMATADLLQAAGDEQYLELLAKAAEIEADKLAQKNTAERLALDFATKGIDTTVIPSDASVEIQLGEVRRTTEEYYEYGNRRQREKDTKVVQRRIKLTALGEGLFRVDSDTLVDSKNPYAATLALDEGVVIKVGQLVSRTNGSTEPHRELSPVLRAGASLQYDTDTSTPDFTDARLPIVNVVVNGISARKIEQSRKEYL